jgi:uncharacterized membrane protein
VLSGMEKTISIRNLLHNCVVSHTVIVPIVVPVAVLVSIILLTSIMCSFGIIIVAVLRTKKAKGELKYIIPNGYNLNKQ